MRSKVIIGFFLTITMFFIGVNISLGQDSTIDGSPIIDSRCTQEKLLNKDGCYATGCWDDSGSGGSGVGSSVSCFGSGCEQSGNKESEINNLVKHCNDSPNENDWGLEFSVIKSDIVFNRATMPLILIMVLTVVYGIAGLIAIVITFFGYVKWVNLSRKSEELADAWKYFTNGLIGVVIISLAIPITWLVFYVGGYQINPFDFDEVFDRLLLVDCPSLGEDECIQFDESCGWSGTTSPVDDEVVGCFNVDV